ncbi:MAG TPA: allantoinase AllB [Bacteroidia bacterium]|jgi:allantoinase|nr:allantoinase AllB [Bacteroidia bacterium]
MTNQHPDFALHSTQVLIENKLQNATLLIKDGIIVDILNDKLTTADFPIEDVGNLVVMPGLIDSHVHINEPGRTEWEGFETMTKAALAGGITTLVDMPLNSSPVTISAKTFNDKLKAAEGKLYCNCGFWGGLVPANADKLDELIKAGVLGIKAFLTHSGIDEFPNVTLTDLKKGMATIAKYQIPLLAHAELDVMHEGITAFHKNPTNYMAYLNSRPKVWEDNAVEMMIELCEEFNCPTHIVHLSSADSLEQIKVAREKGLPLTVETCPQYLYFCAEEIPDGNTLFKCAPPIRERANNEKLWQALKTNLIDFVVTDHSPATPDLKKIETGNLKEAWGGIASIQFSLPVVFTAAQKRGVGVTEVAALMSEHVAKFIGFQNSKGQFKKGYDADIVVWNPTEKFIVQSADIHYRHKISPYVGEQLSGVVKQTYIAGKKVFENGNFISLPQGKVLLKKH